MMRGVRGSRTVAIAGLLAARGLLAVAGAQPPTQENAPAAEAPVAEVVVEGRHAGPRMWTVRSGDHVLWILGTVTPLPKKMIWQPDAVQAVLQQSQEVVPAWPAYGIGANPFTALRVYIEWRRLQKPPDHLPLQKTLPPALYARVEALEARYDPRDSTLEKLRPMLAAERLMTRVLDANGLALHNEVQQTVLRLAREQGVRVRQDKLRIDDPVHVLKDVSTTPLSARDRLHGCGRHAAGDRPWPDARARARLGARGCAAAASAAAHGRAHRVHRRRLHLRPRARPHCARAGRLAAGGRGQPGA